MSPSWTRLERYLRRIGHADRPRADLATLRALHRAHLNAISYENLDIHLGRTLTLDLNDIFNKIVMRGRGGWCYEMNGLFAWALREIGFEVVLLGSAVRRGPTEAGDEHDHLILRVDLEQPYLADVGFGPGLAEPIPLAPGTYTQSYMTFSLSQADGRWWFVNHPGFGAGFDFTLQPRAFEEFGPRCRHLQTSPDSGFVRHTVCHRVSEHGVTSLRGLVLRTLGPTGGQEAVLTSRSDYADVLHGTFDLALDGADLERLWMLSRDRHESWVRGQTGDGAPPTSPATFAAAAR